MTQDTMNEIQSLEVEQTEKSTHSFLQEVFYTIRLQTIYQVSIEREMVTVDKSTFIWIRFPQS